MKTINERIKHFLYLKGLKHNECAKLLNVNPQQFNNWCNSTKPTIEGLEKIIRYFPDLSARWLMTGDGSMIWADELLQRSKEFNHHGNDEFQELLMNLDHDIKELRKVFPLEKDFHKERNIRIAR